jgi:hypothetical protein
MEANSQYESIAGWLSRPETYPHRLDRVDQVETHISHIFLAGSHVYKLKKPVKFDFLDFSTVKCREHACREEVRLNRRLAPDAYLGVVPIVRSIDGAFQLSGQGEVVDWLVEMRRLPTELTLEALLAQLVDHADGLVPKRQAVAVADGTRHGVGVGGADERGGRADDGVARTWDGLIHHAYLADAVHHETMHHLGHRGLLD